MSNENSTCNYKEVHSTTLKYLGASDILGMEFISIVQKQEYYLIALVEIQINIFCILKAAKTNSLNNGFSRKSNILLL